MSSDPPADWTHHWVCTDRHDILISKSEINVIQASDMQMQKFQAWMVLVELSFTLLAQTSGVEYARHYDQGISDWLNSVIPGLVNQ